MVPRRSPVRCLGLMSLAAMLSLASCSSGGSDGAAATETTPIESVVEEIPATSPTTSTVAVASTAAPTTTTEPVGDPIVIDETGTELVEGQRYRYEIHGTTFEFDGVDGWLASRSGNGFFAFLPGNNPVEAFVSMLRLHDARPSSGVDQADPTGLAVPIDPFATTGDIQTGEGASTFSTVRDLPTDWLGYLDGLTGIDFTSRTAGQLGQFDGELASFTVSGLPELPDALCATPADARCVTFAVELTASYYYSEDDEVTLLVTDVGGEPFEFSHGINQRSGLGPSTIEQRDQLVASMEAVD